ncbi:MAG: mercury transporter MerT [Thalassospira sp.]|uniref:mercuric transporter MerT family protein n=1 Tax=Thalassospira TaxID=168934 RepID=UPI0002872D18|nr:MULTISPECIES: mercuric transporter MerT family protein [Thalassospira]EKF07936.1 mercuric transporter MerT [Thalassospira profundimaris WP0211]MBO6842619.1 mercury transporter MerT [Thalassospira sp.]
MSTTKLHASSANASGSIDDGKMRVFATGGVIGAILASSCCIIPLALFSLGVGGAWIGNLTALAPYQPILVIITLGFLGYGYFLVYRKPQNECADGAACARPLPNRIVKLALWFATALIVLALAWPYILPIIIGK